MTVHTVALPSVVIVVRVKVEIPFIPLMLTDVQHGFCVVMVQNLYMI